MDYEHYEKLSKITGIPTEDLIAEHDRQLHKESNLSDEDQSYVDNTIDMIRRAIDDPDMSRSELGIMMVKLGARLASLLMGVLPSEIHLKSATMAKLEEVSMMINLVREEQEEDED